MSNIFVQLAVILSLCSALGMVVYKLKLPLLIAYLACGLLLSAVVSLVSIDISKSSALSFLPDIGIAFVLFLVGMELDLREIKNYGKQILTAGILQVVITSVIGTFVAQSFGFDTKQAMYLGIGLSFSSTLVVVKLLLDRKELTSLYGKLSLGVLLLEDLIAVFILVLMSGNINFSSDYTPLVTFFIKVVILCASAVWLNRYLLKFVFNKVSDSGELLFLTSLAWCFSFITFSSVLGFSILTGAFLAGVVLASSPYHFHIQGRIKPMRDFFLSLFFVYLGTRVDFSQIINVYPLIIIFALYAVIVKPVIYLLIFGIFGFKKHTMFLTSINLSQVSEFSLIMLLVALKLGLVSQAALTVVALSSVLSLIISSLMISQSKRVYKYTINFVSFFERKKHTVFEKDEPKVLENHVVMIGAHRVGGDMVRFLKKENQKMIVLDYNPRQVELLLAEGIPVIYGDMSDPEILDILNLAQAKLIISTAPDLEGNKTLLEDLKLRKIAAPVIVRGETIKEAKSLYKAGADFVIIPDILAGDVVLGMLKNNLEDKSFFKDRPRIELEKLSHKILAWE
jgi:Kef-type K+ transport system membrane component KefB